MLSEEENEGKRNFSGEILGMLQETTASYRPERIVKSREFVRRVADRLDRLSSVSSGKALLSSLNELSGVRKGWLGWLPHVLNVRHFGELREIVGDRLTRLTFPFAFRDRRLFLEESSFVGREVFVPPFSTGRKDEDFRREFGLESVSHVLVMNEKDRSDRIEYMSSVISTMCGAFSKERPFFGFDGRVSLALSSLETGRAGCFWASPGEISVEKDSPEFVVHEWFHALDFALGGGQVPGSGASPSKSPMIASMNRLLDAAMAVRPKKSEMATDLLEDFRSAFAGDLRESLGCSASSLASLDIILNDMATTCLLPAMQGDWLRSLGMAEDMAMSLGVDLGITPRVFAMKGAWNLDWVGREESLFWSFAKKSDKIMKKGKYWSSREEMFARIMETWFWTVLMGMPRAVAGRRNLVDVSSPTRSELAMLSPYIEDFVGSVARWDF